MATGNLKATVRSLSLRIRGPAREGPSPRRATGITGTASGITSTRVDNTIDPLLLCRVVKAALEGFQVAELLIPNSSVQDSGYFWLVGLLYYLFSEVIPGLLVLLALRKPTSSVHPSISPVVLVGESSTQTPLQRGTFGEEMQSEQRSERGASMYSAASSAWYHDAGHDERDEAMYT